MNDEDVRALKYALENLNTPKIIMKIMNNAKI